ncbi:MAG: hypothetical protein WA876_05095 [Candidatus Acidiferrales bacterium]
MGLSSLGLAHWGFGTFIEAVVLILAIRRHLFDRLPFFTIYLFLILANEVITLAVYAITGISSHISFVIAWVMQGLLVSLRALVVYEVCRSLLSPYRGLWRLCRPVLIAVGAILGTTSGIVARQNAHFIEEAILTVGRGLELAIVGILIFGLIFCRYYGIRIERYLAWIALGLGLYSAIQVVNNTFLQHWLSYFSVWNGLRHISFDMAVVFWIIGLRKPLPVLAPSPVLLGKHEYRDMAPHLTARLRELNGRLLEMWK